MMPSWQTLGCSTRCPLRNEGLTSSAAGSVAGSGPSAGSPLKAEQNSTALGHAPFLEQPQPRSKLDPRPQLEQFQRAIPAPKLATGLAKALAGSAPSSTSLPSFASVPSIPQAWSPEHFLIKALHAHLHLILLLRNSLDDGDLTLSTVEP